MFLIGLGALLVLCGILYMARTAIWRGPLSGPDSSRPVRDTLEPPRRSVRFLGAFGELEARAMDIAIIPSDHIPARFLERTLYEEDFVIAIRAGHPFAA